MPQAKTGRPYKGEAVCAHCPKRAYFWLNDKAHCGYCSKGHKTRTSLPKVPWRQAEAAADQIESVHAEAALSSPAKVLIMGRLQNYNKSGPYGYVSVFPNHNAMPVRKGSEKARYVFAFPGLSPMRVGPVDHGNPHLPLAKLMENAWQCSKVFPSEVDPETGAPTLLFYTRRLYGFEDDTPHRHKLADDKQEHLRLALGRNPRSSDNVNVCTYALHWDVEAQEERRYSYLEARVFYCTYYENLIRKTPEYHELCNLYDRHSVCIMGFDSREIDSSLQVTSELLEQWYTDESQPFGHECVLFTCILADKRGLIPPWRSRQHIVYQGKQRSEDNVPYSP